MTTLAEPTTRRQVHHESIVLNTGLDPTAQPVSRYPHRSPIVSVDVMDGLSILSDDVDALRDLAEALYTAASELHAARMEWDEANER